MKNKRLRWGFLFIVILLGIFGLYRTGVFSKKEPIYVAVTVKSTPEEHAGTFRAINSVQLYLDEANAAGGINGHPLKMLIRMDGGDPDQAAGVAREIAEETQAMISLGNTYSDAAQIAGQIYQELHVPVITSGATAPDVTKDNDWFFRVLSDNAEQGSYLAQYAYAILEHKTAAIVYENNSYGTSLGEAFAAAFEEEGGEILNSTPISYSSETLAQDTKDIVASYASFEEEPDIVFLATYKTSGVAMVDSLHDILRNVAIMGGDDIGDASFATKFVENYEHPERLDGVYAGSPLIFDVGSEAAQKFRDKYVEELGEYPTWFSATTYDSALVAVEAMRNAGISGDPANLEEDRQKVRDYLAGIDSHENAIEGITGNIYFNEHHNFAQPMAMGVFESQQFVSAPIQLTSTNSSAMTKEIFDGTIAGQVVQLGSEYAYKTQIAYVGIDINEFKELDIDNEHTYYADFYLWFRYQGELDFDEISFDNAVDKISLGEPLEEKTTYGNTHYRLYHIRDSFTNNFDLINYPFDKQILSISLRHTTQERHNLIFVVDLLGLGDVTTSKTILNSLAQARAFDSITDWAPINGYYHTDTIHEYTTRGDPASFGEKVDIERSRFNIEIEIERDYIRFVSKTMLPIMSILLLSYLGLFLPDREFETITSIMTGTVLSVVFFHVDLSGRLNVGYTVAMDYAFYAIYVLLATELFLSIVAWHKITKNDKDMSVRYLFWFMRALYPIVFILGTILMIVVYDLS